MVYNKITRRNKMISFELIFLFIIMFICAVWLFLSLAVYYIPVIVAYIRKHNNILAITLLTIFLGWTFFGWLAALLWSLNSDVKDKELD